jgi:hypothetical protein
LPGLRHGGREAGRLRPCRKVSCIP